jgi:hypothetical protein
MLYELPSMLDQHEPRQLALIKQVVLDIDDGEVAVQR